LVEVGHEIMLSSGCAISGIVILDDLEVISGISIFIGGTLSIFIEFFKSLFKTGELFVNEFFEIIAQEAEKLVFVIEPQHIALQFGEV
jgi:hypothetical protein